MMTKSNGHLLYEAWADKSGWVNEQGDVVVEWLRLAPHHKVNWEFAANVLEKHILSRMNFENMECSDA